jgi:hypothetical protein
MEFLKLVLDAIQYLHETGILSFGIFTVNAAALTAVIISKRRR